MTTLKCFSLFVFISAGLLTAGGCTTVGVNIPLSRLDSPEVAGTTQKFGMEIGGGGVVNLQYSSDASSRPLTITNPPSLDQNGEVFTRLGFSLTNALEVYYRTNFSYFAPNLVGIKFQLIGQPTATAKAGNFCLAVTAAGVYGYQYYSGNQKGSLGPGGFPWNSDINTTGQDYAAIVGIRLNEYMMIFGGPYMSNYYTAGSIHQGLSSDGTSPAAQTTFSAGTSVQGGNVDFLFHFPFFFQRRLMYVLEYSWANVKSSGNPTTSPVVFGAAGLLEL